MSGHNSPIAGDKSTELTEGVIKQMAKKSNKKGKAARVYSINKDKLKEVVDAVDEALAPLREALDEEPEEDNAD